MSNLTKDAFVVMGMCPGRKQPFGIVVDYEDGKRRSRTNMLLFKWAFPISARQARKEGYDQTKATGNINLDKDYPGCPYCKKKGFWLCNNCGTIVCWNGADYATCPKCGESGEIYSADSFDLSGGGF